MENKVELRQTDLREGILELHPAVRLGLAVIVCALVAYYAPLLIGALGGRMLNKFWMWIDLAVSVVPLIIISLIGHKTNRVWLVSLIVAGLLAAYEVSRLLRMGRPAVLGTAWMAFLPVLSLFINAALFQASRRFAGLAPDESSEQA